MLFECVDNCLTFETRCSHSLTPYHRTIEENKLQHMVQLPAIR
jgi:hypothetical protein